MSYTPTAYTTATAVKRILRIQAKNFKIGDDPNDHLSPADLTEYILDASRLIDGALLKVITSGYVPLTDTYAEISYAAPRLTAFLIYRDMYSGYRVENMPMGPRGWYEDFKDQIKLFVENIDAGVYPTLSPSVDGPGWFAVEKFFINKYGVPSVHDQVSVSQNQLTDITSDNMTPYTDQ